MNILFLLEKYIEEFNTKNNFNFKIDTLRIEFSKQYKKEKIDQLGNWKKINKNDKRIMDKLKKRLDNDEITNAYQLENFNIYYYNKKDTQYRKAEMVIFGMMQYHKEPPPRDLIISILSILKNISNIDLCFDMKYKPNLENLRSKFRLKQYKTNKGVPTDTYYINETFNDMIEKIIIYDKAYKNDLDSILWRIEAKIIIPNYRYLVLPFFEFKEIIDLITYNILLKNN